MKLAYVKWVDSLGPGDNDGPWHDRGEVMKAMGKSKWPGKFLSESSGIVLFEDENRLVLTLSMGRSQIGDYIAIPKAAIVHRQDWEPD